MARDGQNEVSPQAVEREEVPYPSDSLPQLRQEDVVGVGEPPCGQHSGRWVPHPLARPTLSGPLLIGLLQALPPGS